MQLKVSVEFAARTDTPTRNSNDRAGGYVAQIHLLTAKSSEVIATLPLSPNGTFEGEIAIDHKGPVNLRATLHREGSDEILGTSKLLTHVKDRAEFIIEIDTPEPAAPVYSRIHSALKDITDLPEIGSDEFLLLATEVDAEEGDVARYINARRLAPEIRDLAGGECHNTYEDYENSLRDDAAEKAVATKARETSGMLGDKTPRLEEALFAMLGPSVGTTAYGAVLLSREDMTKALEHAAESNQVEPWKKTGNNSVKQIVTRLALLRDGLHFAITLQTHPMAQLCMLADPSVELASQLFDTALDSGTLDGAAGALELDKEQSARLDLVLRLNKAAQDYQPLVAAFLFTQLSKAAQQRATVSRKVITVGSPREIDADAAMEAALKLKPKDWAQFSRSLVKHGFAGAPDGFLQAEGDAKQAADRAIDHARYGETVAASLAVANPRANLLVRLEAKRGNRFAPAARMMRDHPGFDPLQQPARAFLIANGQDIPEEIADIERFQRLAKLAENGPEQLDVVEAMWKAGYHSGTQIARDGRTVFTQQMHNAASEMRPEAIEAAFCKSSLITTMVAETRVQLANKGLNDKLDIKAHFEQDVAMELDRGAIVSGTGTSTPAPTGPITPPNIESMFGSFDTCACRECQSVDSPAAYLNFLALWMKTEVDGAWTELDRRRPDVKHQQLSCAASDIRYPYIDAVCEVIGKLKGLDGDLDTFAIDTLRTEEELALQPEYLCINAQATLKTKYFPLALPYDRSRAEGVAALEAAGSSLADVQEIFLHPDKLQWSNGERTDHIAAVLDLDAWTYGFLTDFSVFDWELHSGYTPPSAGDVPGLKIADIMAALDLSFDDLDTLLSLRTVNHGQTFSKSDINFPDDECSYDNASFTDTGSSFDDAMGHRALSLMRLAKATGASWLQIDNWATAFASLSGQEPTLDSAFLEFLADATQIADRAEGEGGVDAVLQYRNAATSLPPPDVEAGLLEDLFDLGKATDLEHFLHLFGAHIPTGSSPIARLNSLVELWQLFHAHFVKIGALQDIPLRGERPTRAACRTDAAKELLDAAKQAITDKITLTGIIDPDDPAMSALVFEAMAGLLGLPASVCQQIYAERDEKWLPELLKPLWWFVTPADLSGFDAYIDVCWTEAMEHWLGLIFDGCNADADLQTAILALDAPHFDAFDQDFPLLLARLLEISDRARLDPALLVDVLTGGAAPSTTLDDALSLIVARGHAADSLTKLWQAMRLDGLGTALGTSVQEIDQLFPSSGSNLLGDWDGNTITTNRINNAAQLFRNLADHRPADVDKLKRAMDTIRQNLRDAYVADWDPVDPALSRLEDAYQQLLLDPGMEPCMPTSRLTHATAALQLLMQRALFGLEPAIAPDKRAVDMSRWCLRYRLWQANRRIQLTPEPYMDPNLRIGMSPLFERFSEALAQDELSDETIENAVYDYVAELDKIARLDIRAIYRDTSTVQSTLEFIGATWSEPREHYHMTRLADGSFTPWKKVETEPEGSHLLLTKHNGSLFLFSFNFAESQKRGVADTLNWKDPDADSPYLIITASYSKMERGRWLKKVTIDQKIEAGRTAGLAKPFHNPYGPLAHKFDGTDENVTLDPSDFYFWAEENPNGGLDLRVAREPKHDDGWSLHMPNSPTLASKDRRYGLLRNEDGISLSPCNGPARLNLAEYLADTSQHQENSYHPRPALTMPHNQSFIRARWVWEGQIYVQKSSELSAPDQVALLHKHPHPYRLTYEMGPQSDWSKVFAMGDAKHSHLFERQEHCELVQTGRLYRHQVIQQDWYQATPLEHPYTCLMLEKLNQGGVEALYGRDRSDSELRRQAKKESYFSDTYWPNFLMTGGSKRHPVMEFSFDREYPYDWANWDLCVHVPMLVARQLKDDGKFEQAIEWISKLFDPTSRDDVPKRYRYFFAKPFTKATPLTSVTAMLQAINSTSDLQEIAKIKRQLEAEIRASFDNPYNPFAVAGYRHAAYMLWAVLEYVDILILWGDALFRQDTMESVAAATQHYMAVSMIMGDRPVVVDKGPRKDTMSLKQLFDADTDEAGIETYLVGMFADNDCGQDGCEQSLAAALTSSDYFCIPQHPTLHEYWDRIEMRLAQIRCCKNIDGVTRTLQLKADLIDPAALVAATASGLDMDEVMALLGKSALPYNFQFLLAKAQDFTAELKAISAQTLAAIKERSTEELQQIQATHGVNLQKMSRQLKQMNLTEAKERLRTLEHSRNGAQEALDFYTSREFRNFHELKSKNLTYASDAFMIAEQAMVGGAGTVNMIPDAFVGMLNFVHIGGGQKTAEVLKTLGLVAGIGGSLSRSESARAATLGSFKRREQDWHHQAAVTQHRLNEIDSQIAAQNIVVQIAEKTLENADTEIAQAQEVLDFHREKATDKGFYNWLVSQNRKLMREAYELAYNIAKHAEAALKRELGPHITDQLISNDLWQGGVKSVHAGEKLSLELKRLDDFYIQEKARLKEFELNRSVSLSRLDRQAVEALRMGNRVHFKLPAWLFSNVFSDMSLTSMRLRRVALSIPSISAAQATVRARLRLIQSEIEWPGSESETQVITNHEARSEIITSTALSDTGIFDASTNSGRLLPFEYAGAVSEWELEIPEDSEIDPARISDVIMHIEYTARPKSRDSADEQVFETIFAEDEMAQFGLSLKHDFNEDWRGFVADLPDAPGDPSNMSPANWNGLDTAKRIPYIYSRATISSEPVEVLLMLRNEDDDLLVGRSGTDDAENLIGLGDLGTLDIWKSEGKAKLRHGGEDREISDVVLVYSVE